MTMRNFENIKRIVIKVGTNVLSKNSGVDTEFIALIAGQIAHLVRQNRQVILVTSGAIGMGAGALGIRTKVTDVKKRQALAAVGQGILMHAYEVAFGRHDQKVGQVLLTNRILSHRSSYVNLKNAMETLLSMKIVPIVNENDCVSIDEIDLAFGDNDKLSALVASKIDAELLLILTDVDGLYDKNPREDKTARRIPVVYEITPEIESMAGTAGTQFSTGGMASKIAAIKIAAQAGCKVILANGRESAVIDRLIAGEELGTLFLPKRRLSNRKRWILNSHPAGRIEVDPGAETVLRTQRKSLLLVGVTEIKGDFKAESIVQIGAFARGITELSSEELRDSVRKKQTDKEHLRRKTVVHVDNLVLLDA